MQLQFTKMQGLGNDFVVINNLSGKIKLSAEQLRFLADRRFGVGCDQILFVEKSQKADFAYRIFNADGGEVQQCGNGARCFLRFLHEQNLTKATSVRVETRGGIIVLETAEADQVRVNMGVPEFTPSNIPFQAEALAEYYPLMIEGQSVEVGAVSMGNPHAVLQVNDVDTADVQGLGALLESHAAFPERVNVGFMQVLDRDNIRLRVYERGVGETLACGTGACAAAVIGIQRKQLNNKVNVQLRGGNLIIEWQGGQQPVFMTGAATTVFAGEISL